MSKIFADLCRQITCAKAVSISEITTIILFLMACCSNNESKNCSDVFVFLFVWFFVFFFFDAEVYGIFAFPYALPKIMLYYVNQNPNILQTVHFLFCTSFTCCDCSE